MDPRLNRMDASDAAIARDTNLPWWWSSDSSDSSSEDCDLLCLAAGLAAATAATISDESIHAGKGPQGPKIRHDKPVSQFDWAAHVESMQDIHFLRAFRMTPEAFYELRDLLASDLNAIDDKYAEVCEVNSKV